MEARSIAADALFRACFTGCPQDPRTLLLDVRSQKVFKRKHILQDYSGASYDQKWSKDCWWDKPLFIYGDNTLDKNHPVIAFLAKEKRAKSISVYKAGLDAFEEKYPFLCTQSLKAHATVTYPGEIIPNLLYLGNWEHAENFAALKDLGIKRLISIHNNPENLKVPKGFQQLKMTVADVHTQDITPYFNPSYDLIEEARNSNEGVLVHCGAGVSRSASLCIAYLMRRFAWNAARARKHCQNRRSLVNPNDGFWRSLCAFEQVLGITDRSDPGGSAGGAGADAPALLSHDAAGQKVQVDFVPAAKLNQSAKEQPAKTVTALDKRNGTDISNDSPNSDRKRESESDRRRDADSRHKHRKSHRREEEERGGDRQRHRNRDTKDSGHKEKRQHKHKDDSEDEEDMQNHRHRSRRRRSLSRGKDEEEEREQGRREVDGNVAAQDSREASEKEADSAVVLDIARDGREAGQLRLSLAPNQRCVFGRQPGSCDVVLEHLSISRQHAHLSLDLNRRCFITDMGSGHGTNVDGLWLRAKTPRGMQLGSVIKFGASSRSYTVTKLPKN